MFGANDRWQNGLDQGFGENSLVNSDLHYKYTVFINYIQDGFSLAKHFQIHQLFSH